MTRYGEVRLNTMLRRMEPFFMLAEELARVARQTHRRLTRRPRGGTLRPGPGTPLWNALVHSVRPHLSRWGVKSRLARLLGVPPQRVHEYFVRRTAAPDAERTLELIRWLGSRRRPNERR